MPSSSHTASCIARSLVLKSRLSTSSGHASRRFSRNARSMRGRILAKKYASNVGAPVVASESCATTIAYAPDVESRRQYKSCSIANGSPVASARSMRSDQRPASGYALCASRRTRRPGLKSAGICGRVIAAAVTPAKATLKASVTTLRCFHHALIPKVSALTHHGASGTELLREFACQHLPSRRKVMWSRCTAAAVLP